MPIGIIGASSGISADVGGNTFKALHAHIKPAEHGTLGHYGFSVRIISTAAQAANSRIFALRNSHASNLIVLTRLRLRAVQVAAGTAQENSIDAYKVTGFSVSDTTNATTPTVSVKKGAGAGVNMAAAPGGAAVRHLTTTGVAAGMTGGTLTKDTSPFATLPYNVAAAINTTTIWGPEECVPQGIPLLDHPFVFANNEGFIVENRVLNVTSYGIAWFIDVSWAEVVGF